MTFLEDDLSIRGVIATGQPGPPGPAGPTGPAGAGVPTAGTTGQILAKNSNTNFDTVWIDDTGGGGLPTGGTAGQILTKDTSTDFDVSWQDPTGGGGGLASVTSTDSGTLDFSGLGTVGSPLTAVVKANSITASLVAADVATQAELDTVNTALGAHIADTTAAHAASSVSFAPVGTISSTDVQAAIAELEADMAALPTFTTNNLTKTPVTFPTGSVQLDVSHLTADNVADNHPIILKSDTSATVLTIAHQSDARTAGTGATGIEMHNNTSFLGRFAFFQQGGTAAAPAQTPSGATLGGVTFRGSSDGTVFSTAAAAAMIAVTDEAVTTSVKGAHMEFTTTPTGGLATATAVKIFGNAGQDTSFRGGVTVGAGSGLAAPASGYVLEAKSATAGIGYGVGAGGAQTQGTSRTTAVTINALCGQVTLFAAAPTVGTWTTFVLNNTAVRSGDTIRVTCQSCNAANKYIAHAGTIVNATSFEISVTTIVGTTSDSPVFNFSIFRASAS